MRHDIITPNSSPFLPPELLLYPITTNISDSIDLILTIMMTRPEHFELRGRWLMAYVDDEDGAGYIDYTTSTDSLVDNIRAMQHMMNGSKPAVFFFGHSNKPKMLRVCFDPSVQEEMGPASPIPDNFHQTLTYEVDIRSVTLIPKCMQWAENPIMEQLRAKLLFILLEQSEHKVLLYIDHRASGMGDRNILTYTPYTYKVEPDKLDSVQQLGYPYATYELKDEKIWVTVHLPKRFIQLY